MGRVIGWRFRVEKLPLIKRYMIYDFCALFLSFYFLNILYNMVVEIGGGGGGVFNGTEIIKGECPKYSYKTLKRG